MATVEVCYCCKKYGVGHGKAAAQLIFTEVTNKVLTAASTAANIAAAEAFAAAADFPGGNIGPDILQAPLGPRALKQLAE